MNRIVRSQSVHAPNSW